MAHEICKLQKSDGAYVGLKININLNSDFDINIKIKNNTRHMPKRVPINYILTRILEENR